MVKCKYIPLFLPFLFGPSSPPPILNPKSKLNPPTQVYNNTFIRWTTHSPPGLSEKDIHMAQFCDTQALAYGEVVYERDTEAASARAGRELADRVAREGGDCCVPKTKPKPELQPEDGTV